MDDTPETDYRLSDTEEMHAQLVGTQLQLWLHMWVQYGHCVTLVSTVMRQEECCN